MTLSAKQITPLIAALEPLSARRKALHAAMRAYTESKGEAYEGVVAAMQAVNELTDPIEAVIKGELEVVLPAISDQGLPTPAETVGNVIFDEVWSDICKSGWSSLPEFRKTDICEALAKTYMAAVAQARTELGDAEAAAALIGWIEAGNCPLTYGGGDYFKNFAGGRQACLIMEGWAPRLVDKGEGGTIKPLARQPDSMAFHQTISFPSGRLLISDSVRVQSVIDALDDLRDEAGFNINYGQHRVMRTSLSACIFNIVDIAMGDDGPSMVKGSADDILFAGCDDDNFTEVASVCHDYRGTRIVDREVAIALAMASGQTREEVEAEIDAWLAGSQFANEIKVPAGSYNLYWDDDRETLDAILRSAGVDAPEDTRFILSRERIAAIEADERMKFLARFEQNSQGELVASA